MNILVTLDFPPETGGIQQYLHDIVNHTFTAEDAVFVGTNRSIHKQRCNNYPCPVTYVSLPFLFINKKLSLLLLMKKLLLFCHKNRSSATLYAGNIYAAIVTWVLNLSTGIPFRIYTYGSELLTLQKRYSLKRILWQTILKKADTVYYLSGATKTVLLQLLPNEKCIHYPPKISLSKNTVHVHRKKSSAVNLLTVGRMVPHKGHFILLHAVARLPKSLPWKLTIAGNGPLLPAIEERITLLNLTENVSIVTDAISSDLSLLYAAADIFIFPSLELPDAIEGFGIVLLEAMAHSTAIIASASGGITSVFQGRTDCASFVEPGNIVQLEQAITHLAKDLHLRNRMTREGFHLLKEHYVW